jgi:hypothetical protein
MRLQRLVPFAFLSIAPLMCAACADSPAAPSAPNAASGVSAAAEAAPAVETASRDVLTTAAGGRAGSSGVVYVTSQGLYYDTFVARDPLPMEGRFQLLTNGQTEFGPGNPGYLGGRWWEDLNGNGVQDTTDHYFLCPLLPPGRPTP